MINKFNNNRFKYYLINYIWNSMILYKYSLLRKRCNRDDDNDDVVVHTLVEVHSDDVVVHTFQAQVHIHSVVVRSTFLIK